MYDRYSQVPEDGDFPFARWRDIAVSRAPTKSMKTQANSVIKSKCF